MSGWKKWGDGFSGVEKLSRRISLVQSQQSQTQKETAQDDMELSQILPNDSPLGKKGSVTQRGSIHQKGKNRHLNLGTWAPENQFKGLISCSPGSSPHQEEDIQSASSSSDENMPEDDIRDNQINLQPKRVNNKNKLAKSPTPHTWCKKRRLVYDKNPSHGLKGRNNGKKSALNIVSSQTSISFSSDEDAGNRNLPSQTNNNNSKGGVGNTNSFAQLNKNNSMGDISSYPWTVPSFQVASEQRITVRDVIVNAAETAFPQSQRSNARKENSRPKVARRLHCENSPGMISDIESDSEQLSVEGGDIDSEKEHGGGFNTGVSNSRAKSESMSFPHGSENMHHSQDLASQVSICTGSSQSLSSSPHKETIRASEWVTALHKQKTPVKSSTRAQCDQLEDSAKKRTKYASGSLADKVLRIQRRVQSSVSFWNRSVKEGTMKHKQEQSITVAVTKVDKLSSLYICQCYVSGPDKGEKCTVFFSRETADLLPLKVGVAVQIYPPWQQLVRESGERTIMCTSFVCLVSGEQTETLTEGSELQTPSPAFRVTATWECPCSLDNRIPTMSCPATKVPYTLTLCPSPTTSDSMSGQKSPTQMPQQTATLHSIYSSSPRHQVAGGQGHVTSHQIQLVNRTLLESKEMLKCASDVLAPFTATVLRVFVLKLKGKSPTVRYQLLVKDSSGTVALVNVASVPACITGQHGESDATSTVPDWRAGQLEGKSCVFSSFVVDHRTTCDQDLSLFSVIKEVWDNSNHQIPTLEATQRNAGDSDVDSLSQMVLGDFCSQAVQKLSGPPSFAYILQAHSSNGDGLVQLVTTSDVTTSQRHAGEASDVVHIFSLVSVNAALQSCVGDRITFIAKSAVSYREESDNGVYSTKATVYVYDGNVNQRGYSEFHKLELMDQQWTQTQHSSLCLFRDVAFISGKLQCDQYTLILPQDRWDLWGLNHSKLLEQDRACVASLDSAELRVPQLSRRVSVGDIVSLQGHITGVDEESACIVEQCVVCGSDLMVQDSGVVHCSICQKNMTECVSVMKMAAFISCLDQQGDVKVELSQGTIESILPREAEEEGYDVDHVINKKIICKACVVESVGTKSGMYLRELCLT